MTYSYTQISQYLTCPRRYRHRYLDGWQEKDTRAAMLFGRAFEQALAAYFRREDAPATLYREWAVYKNQPLHYSEGDSWDRMLQQGLQLLDRLGFVPQHQVLIGAQEMCVGGCRVIVGVFFQGPQLVRVKRLVAIIGVEFLPSGRRTEIERRMGFERRSAIVSQGEHRL